MAKTNERKAWNKRGRNTQNALAAKYDRLAARSKQPIPTSPMGEMLRIKSKIRVRIK